jgi:hypothetical protein
MRTGALVVLASVAIACGGGGFFKQYEYEEDGYLSLDGRATVYVNSSLAALNVLRGTSFETKPDGPLDLDGVRSYFTTPHSRVARVTTTRRGDRRYVHVRIETDDLRRLSDAPPFAWSSYELNESGSEVVFRQKVGKASGGSPGRVEWRGDEIAAFRLHLPSRILFHNSPSGVQRGNILAWEQPLSERVRGEPVEMEVRVEPQSILYRTLLLFAGTIVAVALTFVLAIWWVIRWGRRPNLERRTRT